MALGIKNIKKLLQFGFDFSSNLKDALEDGKISLLEALSFVPELRSLKDVVKDWPTVKKEIADLTTEEKNELYEFIEGNFDIAEGQHENFINQITQWVVSTLALVEMAKSLKK